MAEIIIIGAGITGLSTAHFCKKKFTLLEKEDQAGGVCRSLKRGNFTFDYSGHLLHLRNQETKKLIEKLSGDTLGEIERRAWIFTHDHYVPYPFQVNLFALPEKIRHECLKGFMRRPPQKRTYPHFLSWSLATFGKGITHYFMKPYNEKLWTVSSKDLSADWVAPFVPVPSENDVQKGSMKRTAKRFGYNATYFYPRKGGVQVIADSFAKSLPIEYGVRVESINISKKFIETSDGKKLFYDTLVSTQPLPELLDSITELPLKVKRARERLNWNSVHCLNLAVKSNHKDSDGRQWVYFPEKKYPFYRAGIYSNIMPSMAPEGYRSFYIEVSSRPSVNPVTKCTVAALIAGLKEAKLLRNDDRAEIAEWVQIPYAYVIYDKYRISALKEIQKFLHQHKIHSIGRYGGWEYSFMEKNIIDGMNEATILNNEQN